VAGNEVYVDDPAMTPAGYISEPVWEGLRLIDYNVAVHYGSQDAQGKAIERTVAYWKSQNVPYLTLRDREVLVVDGDKAEVMR
jgi:peptidase E